jgi:hypothetical protein
MINERDLVADTRAPLGVQGELGNQALDAALPRRFACGPCDRRRRHR